MHGHPTIRAHILSIRDNPADEKLIETILCSDPEIQLQHVDCGAEALAQLQGKQQKLPNLILLAWRFRENQMSASETLRALKSDAILRTVPVVVLAGYLSAESIEELYVAGAACVFQMPSDLDALETVLREIKNLWLNRARLPYELQHTYMLEPPVTEREKDVIRLIAKDFSNKQIAHQLGISQKTVEFHMQRIKTRIGVPGKAGIVRYAMKTGIVHE